MSKSSSLARRIEASWSGRGLLSTALLPLSWLFGLISALRRLGFGAGVLRSEKLSVPVLVVGNLVAGGAGKTPTVLAVVSILRRLGYTPGIISRGYRPAGEPSASTSDRSRKADVRVPIEVMPTSTPDVVGDEPLLLRLRTRAPVFVGPDRVAAGRALLSVHPEVDIIVSDDGLQHLRLARDAAVIVFDERGAGNGRLLPAGPLRERPPRDVPKHAVVLYNAASPSTHLPGHLARPALSGAVTLADWWSGRGAAEPGSLSALLPGSSAARHGSRVLALAGVARPERFFGMLEDHGLAIDRLALPDHFDFASHPWPRGTTDVIVTEKDAVKLRPDAVGATRVWVVGLDFHPDPAFASALQNLLPPPRRP